MPPASTQQNSRKDVQKVALKDRIMGVLGRQAGTPRRSLPVSKTAPSSLKTQSSLPTLTPTKAPPPSRMAPPTAIRPSQPHTSMSAPATPSARQGTLPTTSSSGGSRLPHRVQLKTHTSPTQATLAPSPGTSSTHRSSYTQPPVGQTSDMSAASTSSSTPRLVQKISPSIRRDPSSTSHRKRDSVATASSTRSSFDNSGALVASSSRHSKSLKPAVPVSQQSTVKVIPSQSTAPHTLPGVQSERRRSGAPTPNMGRSVDVRTRTASAASSSRIPRPAEQATLLPPYLPTAPSSATLPAHTISTQARPPPRSQLPVPTSTGVKRPIKRSSTTQSGSASPLRLPTSERPMRGPSRAVHPPHVLHPASALPRSTRSLHLAAQAVSPDSTDAMEVDEAVHATTHQPVASTSPPAQPNTSEIDVQFGSARAFKAPKTPDGSLVERRVRLQGRSKHQRTVTIRQRPHASSAPIVPSAKTGEAHCGVMRFASERDNEPHSQAARPSKRARRSSYSSSSGSDSDDSTSARSSSSREGSTSPLLPTEVKLAQNIESAVLWPAHYVALAHPYLPSDGMAAVDAVRLRPMGEDVEDMALDAKKADGEDDGEAEKMDMDADSPSPRASSSPTPSDTTLRPIARSVLEDGMEVENRIVSSREQFPPDSAVGHFRVPKEFVRDGPTHGTLADIICGRVTECHRERIVRLPDVFGSRQDALAGLTIAGIRCIVGRNAHPRTLRDLLHASNSLSHVVIAGDWIAERNGTGLLVVQDNVERLRVLYECTIHLFLCLLMSPSFRDAHTVTLTDEVGETQLEMASSYAGRSALNAAVLRIVITGKPDSGALFCFFKLLFDMPHLKCIIFCSSIVCGGWQVIDSSTPLPSISVKDVIHLLKYNVACVNKPLIYYDNVEPLDVEKHWEELETVARIPRWNAE